MKLVLYVVLSLAICGCGMPRIDEDGSGGTIGVDLDRWANAIRKAEGNPNYGIISIPCDSEAQCRKYCKNTVYNTLVKYRATRCMTGESDLDCLARRYCPVGSDTDDGTCQYWKKNVRWFLNNA